MELDAETDLSDQHLEEPNTFASPFMPAADMRLEYDPVEFRHQTEKWLDEHCGGFVI